MTSDQMRSLFSNDRSLKSPSLKKNMFIFIVIARLVIFIFKIKNNISKIISPSCLTFFVWKSEELGYKLVWPKRHIFFSVWYALCGILFTLYPNSTNYILYLLGIRSAAVILPESGSETEEEGICSYIAASFRLTGTCSLLVKFL